MDSIQKVNLQSKTNSNRLRDIILGGQDGLVNVLGIVLGVSAASGDTKILITAALSAAFAEAISMGAVAYTSTMSEHDHYLKEQQREQSEMEQDPQEEKAEIRAIYEKKGFQGELLNNVVGTITANKDVWLETMMEEELELSDIPKKSVFLSAFVVGIAAIIGSIIPIIPFFIFPKSQATVFTLVISSIALFSVGVYEAKTFVGVWWKSGLRIMLIGMGAALVGYLIGHLLGSEI